MYHHIVRSKVRATFERINEGDYLTMVDGLAPQFEYRFHGDHALGGHRATRDAMIRWWERATRLLPGVRFDVQEVPPPPSRRSRPLPVLCSTPTLSARGRLVDESRRQRHSPQRSDSRNIHQLNGATSVTTRTGGEQ